MSFTSEISAANSYSCSMHEDVMHSPIRVEMVSNSVSRRLLNKFCDIPELGFHYSQSRLWSPPFQPSMFLSSSPGNAIVTPDDMLLRLQNITQLRQRRRHGICFNAFWCFTNRSRGSFCCS